jgi:nitrite reductase/ring-hydroxylating ferredoxin subunit
MGDEAADPVAGGPPHRESGAEAAEVPHRSTARGGAEQPAPDFVDVAGVREVPEGTLLAVTLPAGDPVCLFQHGGTIGAIGNRCTHAEFAMSDGVLHADGAVECVWHGARFDCRTGAVKRRPAIDPLPVHQVRVEKKRVLVGPVVPPPSAP